MCTATCRFGIMKVMVVAAARAGGLLAGLSADRRS
jgi:hypothetical protein